MRLKSAVVFFAGMCLFAANQVLAASPKDRCALPPSLRDEISKTYPRARPVSLARGYVLDRKSTRLNSSHVSISYAVFCLKKKKLTVVAPNSSATTVHLTRETSRPIGSNTARNTEPAVHREYDARHERGRVAAQPLHRADDLVGRAFSFY